PALPVVLLRGADHRGDVLPEVGQQRDADRVRLQVAGVLVEDLVGRIRPDDLLVVPHQGGAADVEDFTRTGSDHDLARAHAVVRCARPGDVVTRLDVSA